MEKINQKKLGYTKYATSENLPINNLESIESKVRNLKKINHKLRDLEEIEIHSHKSLDIKIFKEDIEENEEILDPVKPIDCIEEEKTEIEQTKEINSSDIDDDEEDKEVQSSDLAESD